MISLFYYEALCDQQLTWSQLNSFCSFFGCCRKERERESCKEKEKSPGGVCLRERVWELDFRTEWREGGGEAGGGGTAERQKSYVSKN